MDSITEALKKIQAITTEVATTRLSMTDLVSTKCSVKFMEKTKFKPMNDARLEKFFLKALRWINAVYDRHNTNPHWFTVCGRSGTGKTMLLTEMFNFCETYFRSSSKINGDRVSLFDFYKTTTIELAESFRAYGYNKYAEDADLLFVDDIGAEKDTTGFVKGKLCELLCRRMGKWTLITSNLTLTELGNNYDSRISSRIVRDDNIFVPLYWIDKTNNEVKYVQDYAMRKYG